ncbi:MAG: choice-of-anchor J domain-containing protein [Ginsengibacter sp.]
MKKIPFLFVVLTLQFFTSYSQQKSKHRIPKKVQRCLTMEYMAEAIRKDPSLPAKWKIEGEKKYNAYLQRRAAGKVLRPEAAEVIIPIVFHLVDDAGAINAVTDRDIYEQVEILNRDYGGKRADLYKDVIPDEITARIGRISLKFVLARRTPGGSLTTGIERLAGPTPDHISIKSAATGGLDPWDETKYVNVWAGTFSGSDAGLLGISTFPYTTDQGPQGVVISITTIPLTGTTSREYAPDYDEGCTLAHEIGHYFYLYHTFGDQNSCNNADFRLEDGWPLPTGAGPEGDDTPEERQGPGNAYFGNPSENYDDGCTAQPFGMMYGSFMNYFDDRALFMFSDGLRKRVEGCIELYRPELATSDGATPPVDVTDAFLVDVTPRGTAERRAYIVNNTPLSATVRNSGTATLTSVTINVNLDGLNVTPILFPLTLSPGKDTILSLAPIAAVTGLHTVTIAASDPNGTTDTFSNNDTLESFIYIHSAIATLPFAQDFTQQNFPPAGWQVWNPNGGTVTWERDSLSGFTAAGAATVQNFDYQEAGQMDELVSPGIDLGPYDRASLSFSVAYAVIDGVDVSAWDGLEVYISGDGGANYHLAYKKTGNQLKTIMGQQADPFVATIGVQSQWRTEKVDLTPYIVDGKKMFIKFRNTNAYGNNLYLDDISVAGGNLLSRDAYPLQITGVQAVNCTGTISPVVSFSTNGRDTLKSLLFNYQVDNGAIATLRWSGALGRSDEARFALDPMAGLQPGNHVLTVYTTSPNGLPDLLSSNDTIRLTFSIVSTVTTLPSEGFETATFPPENWVIDNPDGILTWERTTAIAKTGAGSMVIRNFDYPVENSIDKFVSPIVTLPTTPFDSIFVSFDYAYAPGNKYPGSTQAPLDTLEVQVTPDCGQTLLTIFKKWGEDLQTINDPNMASGSRFTPNGVAQWKSANIYLDPVINDKNFQLYFVAKSNKQNDLYIDNINIYTKVLPQRLKNQGYLVYPNPFRSSFIIRNYQVPTTLMNIGVYNSIGQLVWARELNGNGNTEMTVDLGNLAAGIYIVKLTYIDKTVVERIVKQ